ncbi:unnamed protein product [Sphagnum tenellum]
MGPATNHDGTCPSGTPGFHGSLYGMSISAGIERVVIWATACGGGGNGADTVGVLHQAIATNVDKVVSVKEEVKVGDYGGSSSDGDGSQGEEVVIGAFTE